MTSWRLTNSRVFGLAPRTSHQLIPGRRPSLISTAKDHVGARRTQARKCSSQGCIHRLVRCSRCAQSLEGLSWMPFRIMLSGILSTRNYASEHHCSRKNVLEGSTGALAASLSSSFASLSRKAWRLSPNCIMFQNVRR